MRFIPIQLEIARVHIFVCVCVHFVPVLLDIKNLYIKNSDGLNTLLVAAPFRNRLNVRVIRWTQKASTLFYKGTESEQVRIGEIIRFGFCLPPFGV